MAVKREDSVIRIEPIQMTRVEVMIVGVSPLIMHRFSAKAWKELLYPSEEMTRAEKAQTLKHEPLEEYQQAFYKNRDPGRPALFHLPCGAFERAIAQAGVDIPGAARATLGRLTSIISRQIDLFGIPQLDCEMIRQKGISGTPDVRFRPVFPQWACRFTIEYKRNPLTDEQVVNLVAAAGVLVGIGDSRPEKGGGSILGKCGRWRLCEADDPEYLAIVSQQGSEPQQAAFLNPTMDEETEELLSWYALERARRQGEPRGARRRLNKSDDTHV